MCIGHVQLSSLRGLGSLVFEGALYLSARSNQGNTVITSVDLGKGTLLQCQLILDMITKSFCVLKACLNSSKKIFFFFAKKRKKVRMTQNNFFHI